LNIEKDDADVSDAPKSDDLDILANGRIEEICAMQIEANEDLLQDKASETATEDLDFFGSVEKEWDTKALLIWPFFFLLDFGGKYFHSIRILWSFFSWLRIYRIYCFGCGQIICGCH
jgi:hypothetical protein